MIRIIYLSLLITFAACSKRTENIISTTEYQEEHRLQFHFSPKEKWMNDPNGMVYHNGEYHLFYQYYPDSTVWGPMHWGHAVSKDLTQWEHLPIALYPDSLGYIFSGSAVFDKDNTSGFGTISQPPLVATFTYHDNYGEKQGSDLFQTQAIAYSIDNGRTWVKYEGNPVLNNPGIRDFRDPKVIWMETQNKWIMALAVKDHISFYSSPDLKKWNHESDFGQELGAHGGVWECPDLFQLDEKWVLLVSINPGGPNGGSATQYFVGDFDGKTFVPQDALTRWLDYGRDNYAGVTWSDIPETDGRRLFIGWMSNWDYANVVPTEKWRSAMTVPRELSLAKKEDKYTVKSGVVREMESLHKTAKSIEKSSAENFSLNEKGWLGYDLELHLAAVNLESKSFKIQLSNSLGDLLILGHNVAEKSFYINRDGAGKNEFAENFKGIQKAPFAFSEGIAKLRILVDIGSIEVIVNDGELAMTALFFPQQPLNKVHFINESEGAIEVSGNIYEMKSIWE